MQPLYLKQSKLYDPKTIEEIVKHTKKWNISSSFSSGIQHPTAGCCPLQITLLPSLIPN